MAVEISNLKEKQAISLVGNHLGKRALGRPRYRRKN
jgi:hypothetical protein